MVIVVVVTMMAGMVDMVDGRDLMIGECVWGGGRVEGGGCGCVCVVRGDFVVQV